jgi:hypothetical protein
LSLVAPFAEYALTAAPAGLEYDIPGGSPVVLTAGSALLVSAQHGDGIFVRPDARLFHLGWRGTHSHSISFLELGPRAAERTTPVWVVSHMADQTSIALNGVPWHGGGPRALASGDRVSPASGLEFTFRLRPDLEELASEFEALRWTPAGDRRVLADWVMERTGFDAAGAALACRHFATRRSSP